MHHPALDSIPVLYLEFIAKAHWLEQSFYRSYHGRSFLGCFMQDVIPMSHKGGEVPVSSCVDNIMHMAARWPSFQPDIVGNEKTVQD